MAKDRARNSRRVFKDVGSMQRMGAALGYRSLHPNGDFPARTVHGNNDKEMFTPGAGHVRVGETLPTTGEFLQNQGQGPLRRGTKGIKNQ